MRFALFALALVGALSTSATAQEIAGSGSTFCYPMVAKLAAAYEKIGGARISYQPIGSALGITEIGHDIVDFAVSEAPMLSEQLLRDGLSQFPFAIGAIVPVVNLDGIVAEQLRFTGSLLADIYLGKVTKWNDPAITALNSGLKLPNLAILVVHRSDGSGTTFNWANYLSQVSEDWKVRIGVNTSVAWPAGVGGKGNAGVADNVKRVRGAIGYIDYPYAVRAKLAYGLVRNRAGNFVTPDMTSFEAATASADWMKQRDFYTLLADAPEANAYPIMATSFVLVRKYPHDPARGRDMLAFFRWALENGQETASSLGFLPLPGPLVQQIEDYWAAESH
jgi:phosphate transport system substrate-binding protein